MKSLLKTTITSSSTDEELSEVANFLSYFADELKLVSAQKRLIDMLWVNMMDP